MRDVSNGVRSGSVRAVVGQICGEGSKRFAVTYPEEGSAPKELCSKTVTFSLNRNVWNDDLEPEQGQIVVLDNLRLFERGWRAGSARPITLKQ